MTVVADDFVKPNGLAFSPDERILYIADTGASHDPERTGRAISGLARSRPTAPRLAPQRSSPPARPGCSTVSASTSTGRIWASAADGVHIYHPDGTLIGKVAIPEIVANVCWGGPKLNRLFICGTTSLYAVMTHTNGAQWPST
jgi:gluconolactonase